MAIGGLNGSSMVGALAAGLGFLGGGGCVYNIPISWIVEDTG